MGIYMSKFIACTNGSYLNISHITNIKAHEGDVIVFYIDDFEGADHAFLIENLGSQEEAQKWLDKFMQKYSLCIEPPIQPK